MLPSSETSWASSCSASSPKLLAKPRQTSSPSLLCSSSVFGLALFVFSSFSQSPPASSKSPTHSLKNGFPTASLPQPLSSFQTFLASPPSLSQRWTVSATWLPLVLSRKSVCSLSKVLPNVVSSLTEKSSHSYVSALRISLLLYNKPTRIFSSNCPVKMRSQQLYFYFNLCVQKKNRNKLWKIL